MALKPSLKHVKEQALNNESCFRKVDTEIPLMIHPMYSSDLKNGVIAELEQMMNRSYSKRLNGVPVYYEKVQLLSQKGWIFGAEPFIHIPLRATFYVFSPELGVTLKGVVKKASLNHVGCLVHGLFNVSVLRSQSNDTEQWCGDKCKEGDELELIVTSLDVTGYAPHILAKIVPESIPDHSEEKVSTNITAKPKGQQSRHIVFNDEDSGISTTDSTESPEHHKKIKKKKNKRGDRVSSASESIDEGHDGDSKIHLDNVKHANKTIENKNTVDSVKSKFVQLNENEFKDEKGQANVEVDTKTEIIIGSEEKPLKAKKKDKKGSKKDVNAVEDFTCNFSMGSSEHKFQNTISDVFDKEEDGYQKHKKKKKKKNKDKREKADLNGVPKEEIMDIVSDISRLIEREENKEEKTKKTGKKRKSSESGLLDSVESSSKYFQTLNSGMDESKAENTKKLGKKRKSPESGILDSFGSSIKSKTSSSRVEESLNPNSLKGVEQLKVKKDYFLESMSEAHNSRDLDMGCKKKKKKKSLEKIADLTTLDEIKQSSGKDCLRGKDEKSTGKKLSSENKKKHSSNSNTSTPNSLKTKWNPKFNIDDIVFDDLPSIR